MLKPPLKPLNPKITSRISGTTESSVRKLKFYNKTKSNSI